MDGEQRQEVVQDPTHILPSPRHRAGEGRGEEQLQPLLAAAYLRAHIRGAEKKARSQMLNEITRASRSPSHERQMCLFPPSSGTAEPRAGLTTTPGKEKE